MATYSVADEFGNMITTGLQTFDAAKQAARHYLSAHKDAPCVEVYEGGENGESWTLTRDEVLS